jgi:hypothetical protein
LEGDIVSAADALKAARAAGISVRINGGDLALEASVRPPQAVLDLLSRHKPGILTLLQAANDGRSADDWQDLFDKRARTAELDGLPRRRAEARAFDCCVAEWLNRNPVRSSPERCVGCGGDDRASDPLLPFGAESTGHAWLHSRCWPAWYAGRKAEAVASLASMDIKT